MDHLASAPSEPSSSSPSSSSLASSSSSSPQKGRLSELITEHHLARLPLSTGTNASTGKGKGKSLSLPPPTVPDVPMFFPSSPPSRSARTLSPTGTPRRPLSMHTTRPSSPSKLPATDSLSYFPPFESWAAEVEQVKEAGGESEDGKRGGPSARSSSEERRGTHGKGKSLGSLATLMAWATFSPTSTPSAETAPVVRSASVKPTNRSRSASGGPMIRSTSDTETIQALSRRFVRDHKRVLEPLTVNSPVTARTASLLGLRTTEPKQVRERARSHTAEWGSTGGKRGVEGIERPKAGRVVSEMTVERMLDSGTVHDAALIDEDEAKVEQAVGLSKHPTLSSSSHHLSLPPPSLLSPPGQLPNWRFPLPSPPIASLCPDIPAELFQYEISNPASASSSPSKIASLIDIHDTPPPARGSSSATTSATASSSSTTLDRDDEEQQSAQDDGESELDEIEGSLSFTSSSHSDQDSDPSGSKPTTPNRSPLSLRELGLAHSDPRFWTPSSPSKRDTSAHPPREEAFETIADEEEYLSLPERLKLRRTASTASRASCDSKETIKAPIVQGQGEITPRAGRGWRPMGCA